MIRIEQPGDEVPVRQIHVSAFGQRTEADLVDLLRQSCPAALSIVAEVDGCIVGHILFTPATVAAGDGHIEGMGLAPMAVMPSHQGQGIGSGLVEEGLQILRDAGCPFVIVVGHADYYPRFGFEPASEYRLFCPWDGVPDEAFMVVILDSRRMEGVTGIVRYREEFDSAT